MFVALEVIHLKILNNIREGWKFANVVFCSGSPSVNPLLAKKCGKHNLMNLLLITDVKYVAAVRKYCALFP